MVPDFEYFLLFSPHGGFGHTLPGVFVFDLPAAFITLWLFHAFLKQPLYSWLPESVQHRIELGPPQLPVKNLAQFLLVLLSILIGAATHLLWDSFTHRNFWPYRHWQFLHRTVQLPVFGSLEYLRVIQHASTLFGAIVILLWFRHWYRRTPPIQSPTPSYPRRNPRAALFVISIAALAAAALSAFLIPDFRNPPHVAESKFLFERAVITAINVFCLGVLLYGALKPKAACPDLPSRPNGPSVQGGQP